jgi:GNAT superfamily N-acetyltransferase
MAVRDAGGRFVGGLQGVTTWGWLYVIIVWVDEAHRGRGVGTRLMDWAEGEARKRGCENACLSSYSFQAPEFYRRRGYAVFGQLEDYPAGHTMYFLRKRLAGDGSS